MATGSLTETLRETLEQFGDSGEPLTTTDVADTLAIGRRSTYDRLTRLADRGLLDTKKVGANGRVWWRPDASASTADESPTDDPDSRAAHDRELERYETIVETVSDGIYVVDQNGYFTAVNGAYESMVGQSRERLLGTHVSTVIDDEETLRAAKRLEAELATGERTDASLEATLGDGADGTRVAEATFALMQAPDGYERVAVVRDVTDRIERERTVARQRERLAALNVLNGVFRDITRAVIDQSTREEIEGVVCDRLAAADSFALAWIGDFDVASQAVTLRTEAGADGYLDDLTVSVDPDDERGQGPTGRALRTNTVQAVQDNATDGRFEPWRDRAAEYGFRSSVAAPIVNENTTYGVLNVYSERPHAFERQVRTLVGQLGEIIGHAIAATERKRALTSDDIVAVEFRITDVFESIGIEAETTGTITLEEVVPVADDEYLVYGTATPDAVESVTAMTDALSHWTSVQFRDDGDVSDFELRLSDPPVLSTVASLGGSVEEAVIEDGDYRMTLHLSPTVDIGHVIDTVEDAYPSAEMVARRQRERTEDTPARPGEFLDRELTDRQHAVLLAAYHAGFFEWPRNVSTDDLATSLDIAPSTLSHHLRKAEQRVFDALLSDSV